MTKVGSDPAASSTGAVDPVERVAAALRSHNIETVVVDTAQDAPDVVLVREPVGI
jgi:selenocysteine lyase/cysteine desulfurase